MWNVINSRFFAAIAITFGLPAMLYVVAVLGSQTIASSITAGIGDSVAEMAKGENKKSIQSIVSGFTVQLIAGMKEPFSNMKKEQEQEKIKEVEILDSITVQSVKMVPSDWGGSKIIGTITNTSDKYLEQIHVSISAYDLQGNLQNVSSEWVSDIKVIKPRQSANFGINPSMLRPAKDTAYIAPARIEVSISRFSVLEVESKKVPMNAS